MAHEKDESQHLKIMMKMTYVSCLNLRLCPPCNLFDPKNHTDIVYTITL